ncbi:MAG TPA: undecaprenyl-diphosphate phosphatase, partial [Candidatus Onthocola stercoravium]|nr:undecaprenyl-diphosphate phosphatase [Candidatus Onthocola stercoravium]
MNIITYIILGIIQGITEPLPISSSGHIYLFKNIFETTIFNTLNFEIISNFGSFIAIFII